MLTREILKHFWSAWCSTIVPSDEGRKGNHGGRGSAVADFLCSSTRPGEQLLVSIVDVGGGHGVSSNHYWKPCRRIPAKNLSTVVTAAPLSRQFTSVRGFSQIAEPVFEINDLKAWKTVAITLGSIALGYAGMAVAPWYLYPLVYAYLGTAMTGLFVVGHDCGHNSFSNNHLINDFVETVMFMPLMYLFEPWRIKHNTHHAHTNKSMMEGMELPIDLVDYVRSMLSERVMFKKIVAALNISDPRRLKRLMTKALGRKFRVFDKFTIEDLFNKIQALLPIREHGANWGIFHVKAALGRLRVRPPRSNIARALQVLSGAHYERRRRGLSLTQRQYNVTVPMALWRIDSYDKLTMYGLRNHGCIDGASHYVLYAQVAADKTQETIFEPFRAVMQKFGTPLRVRFDFVVEHVLICEYMEEARVDTRNPFLVGSSVHN